MSGTRERIIETPKPLWNLFWLLAERPDRLYLLIVLLIGGMFLLFQNVARKLTGSVGYGVVASLLVVFGLREVGELFINGNWTILYMLLGFLLVLALLGRRWVWAVVAVGLMGLIRPESWLLAVFLVVYVVYQRERLKWYQFLPLAAPFLWMAYDYRLSGDAVFSYRMTTAYAVLTGIPGANPLSFWPHLIPDVIESTAFLIPLYGLAGMVLRALRIHREAGARRPGGGQPASRSPVWDALLDPLFVVTVLPLLAAWVLSIPGNIIVMRRFFYLSIALLTLYAVLVPYELFRGRRVANRLAMTILVLLPLVLVGLVRLPGIMRDMRRNVKVSESKMAAIGGLSELLSKPLADYSNYKHIFIPLRRYAQFNAFVPADIARKFLSYREVSLAVTSTQIRATEGSPPQPPAGSPDFVRQLMVGDRRLADFLPSLAVWVPDDEKHYIDAFSFDEPEYFRKSYIETRGSTLYGFRIIGQALDSLGLIYDVREIEPEQVRTVTPPEPEELPRLGTPGLKEQGPGLKPPVP